MAKVFKNLLRDAPELKDSRAAFPEFAGDSYFPEGLFAMLVSP
jgi:hypothetical protein